MLKVRCSTFNFSVTLIQDRPNFYGDLPQAKGLLDESSASLVQDLLGQAVDAVAAGKKRLDSGIQLFQIGRYGLF